MYVNGNMGQSKISKILNEKELKTKRGCDFSQAAISRILTNRIYVGEVINGKEEVADFLTGKRRILNQEDWLVIKKPELKIIEESLFDKAMLLMEERNILSLAGERHSNKHIFSKIIKCGHCKSSFRKVVRTYKNTYVRWVCTGRSIKGKDYCYNKTVVDEVYLLDVIRAYFLELLKQEPKVLQSIRSEYKKHPEPNGVSTQKQVQAKLNKAKKNRQKYFDIYSADIISIEELKEKIKQIDKEIKKMENNLDGFVNDGTKEKNFIDTSIDEILSVEFIDNNFLQSLIEKIVVDEVGNVEVLIREFI